jgi:lipoprotein-anchoring transpeptidase ErfK/SrfK
LLRAVVKERKLWCVPMLRLFGSVAISICCVTAAAAQPLPMQGAPYPMPRMVVVAPAQSQPRSNLGGGFVEFLFGDRGPSPQVSAPPQTDRNQRPIYANADPYVGTEQSPPSFGGRATPRFDIDPRYQRQEVEYRGSEEPGTVVIDTDNKFLYLVEAGNKALRYGIGVGREGFTWSGTHKITAKREWPDWTPPEEMLERQPYLPRHMAGGPNNPLGARALYIGSTLYRIHGTNEDWTIGTNVSSGCIRLRNADVVDLYNRVPVGAKVVVM